MDLRRPELLFLEEQDPRLGVHENGCLDGVEVDLVGVFASDLSFFSSRRSAAVARAISGTHH